MIKYCKRCFYTSEHPLHLTFDDEGVCSGCRVHEEKDEIDWQKKAKKLKKILDSYKNRSQTNYDCIIPVSGARDSYFIVDLIKNKYGMNPLLVTYNKHYNTPLGIRNLANLRIQFDCDLITSTVNPELVKRLTRITLRDFGSMYWHCLAGQTVFPVQVAVRFKIPLIIWGAHQGVDQVGMFSHHDEVEMTRKYRKEHDLMGYEAEDLIRFEDGIKEEDMIPFLYPSDRQLATIGVRGIYLNNYIRWDSKQQHESMIENFAYQTTSQTRTFDTYNDVDCFHYSDIHDYIKFAKHGYGKVVDHATRELRLKRLSRSEGISLIENNLFKQPQSIELFCQWLGITKEGFEYVINHHRNPKFWRESYMQPSIYTSDYLVQLARQESEAAALPVVEACHFKVTEPQVPHKDDDHYILIGKGYPQSYSY